MWFLKASDRIAKLCALAAGEILFWGILTHACDAGWQLETRRLMPFLVIGTGIALFTCHVAYATLFGLWRLKHRSLLGLFQVTFVDHTIHALICAFIFLLLDPPPTDLESLAWCSVFLILPIAIQQLLFDQIPRTTHSDAARYIVGASTIVEHYMLDAQETEKPVSKWRYRIASALAEQSVHLANRYLPAPRAAYFNRSLQALELQDTASRFHLLPTSPNRDLSALSGLLVDLVQELLSAGFDASSDSPLIDL